MLSSKQTPPPSKPPARERLTLANMRVSSPRSAQNARARRKASTFSAMTRVLRIAPVLLVAAVLAVFFAVGAAPASAATAGNDYGAWFPAPGTDNAQTYQDNVQPLGSPGSPLSLISPAFTRRVRRTMRAGSRSPVATKGFSATFSSMPASSMPRPRTRRTSPTPPTGAMSRSPPDLSPLSPRGTPAPRPCKRI